MKKKLLKVAATCGFTLMLAFSSSAFAAPVLVSQSPWGQNYDINNMNDVFGAGNYTTYTSFASANVGNVFSASNSFVMLEGGDGSQSAWSNYVNANNSAILNWVTNGGNLLLMSAGWNIGSITLGPGSLTYSGSNLSPTGTLTAAGQTAFTFTPTPTTQSGSYLAHDTISGTGLTTFMTGYNGNAIVAGTNYGNGYIMYSALTDSEFHSSGNGLVDDVIAFTADQSAPVPEPSTVLLLGAGLLGVGFARRKAKKQQIDNTL